MVFLRRIPVVSLISLTSLVSLTLISCRRDPAVAKKQYLESGNKFYEHERYKNAAIQYQNAIKIDPKYGPAYYKLGQAEIKMRQPGPAVKYFRRAVELLADNQAYQEEYKDSMVQLAQLDLEFLKTDKSVMETDVPDYIARLFKKDPNSYDAYRLRADLNFTKAHQSIDAPAEVAEKLYQSAMDDYQTALKLKPNDAGVNMEIGLILEHEKKYAEAEPYFRKAVEIDSKSYPVYMSLYRLYMTEQKANEAEALLKDAIQNNPKEHVYLERLAYHYGALGRRDDMLNVLAQIKARKDIQGVYRIVGDFYVRVGDAESALREYREGIQKDPKNKISYQKDIIQVLLRQGKKAEAAEVNNEILKDNPKDGDAKSLSATFLLDQGDVNAALTQLQAVVTSFPDNAVAHYQLGRAYLASGRPDGPESARQQFETAIKLLPQMLQPRLGLAQLQVMKGEYDAALSSVQEVLLKDPGNVNARVIQSQAYLGQKKFGESDNLLNGMLKSNPNSPEVYYQAGLAAMAEGKPDLAEKAFQRAYELNPANSKSLLGVVDALIEENHPDQAMALLEREAKKSPNRLDIPLLLGTTAQREGKFQDSLGYFTRVLNGLDKKSKTRADLYVQIAYTYQLAGDRNSAISNLQKAREILPENEIVLQRLGLVMDLAGRAKEAREAYEASLHINPNNAEVLNNLAFLMAENGWDLDVALNYAQKAKGLAPSVPEISDTYGWILLKKGLVEQAIPVFQDLVNRVPANASYRYHLGKAYAQKGDNVRASNELREALKHSPSKEDQQQIQDLLTRVTGR